LASAQQRERRHIDDAQLERERRVAEMKDQVYQLKATIGKVYRDYKSNLYQPDHDIIQQFVTDPYKFMDNDLELVLNLK
jgi:hypothetical protein